MPIDQYYAYLMSVVRVHRPIPALSQLDLRIPNWDSQKLLSRRCPICGRVGKPEFRRPDELIIRHCSRCDLYFVSPAPDPAQLHAFYQTYFARHRREEFLLHRNDHFLVKEMLAANPRTDLKVRVLSSMVDLPGKRILDVGFGMGQLMVLLQKEGADVHGIDLDPDAVAFARDVLHLKNVRHLDIARVPRSEQFDLIILHDLVEHPLQPLELLRSARNHLVPGGLLSVWTPNASFVNREQEPTLFRVDLEHMQYLSANTCNWLAAMLDLAIVHLDCVGFADLNKIGWLSGKTSRVRSLRLRLRRVIGTLPGAARLNALRRKILSSPPTHGSYHLFCIFQALR